MKNSIKIKLFSLFALLTLIPSKLSAHVVEVDDGYIFTLEQYQCYGKIGDKNFDTNDKGSTSKLGHSSLKCKPKPSLQFFHNCYFHNGKDFPDCWDMGFIASATLSTYFSITYYDNNKVLFIKSIEIQWSDKVGSENPLWINARANNPYNLEDAASNPTLEVDDVINNSDESVELLRTNAYSDLTQTYVFTKPVNYLVISGPTSGDNKIIRIASFKIHFTYEDPTIAKNETVLVLGSGLDNDRIDLPWSKEDIMLENIVNASSYPETNPAIPDLRFFLTPQFEATQAPDAMGEQPEDIDDTHWYIYQQLEGGNPMNYDGYVGESLSDDGKIECAFDASSGKLTINTPCSGLYKLSVESETENIKANSLLLNIYPDITHTYDIKDRDEEGMTHTTIFAFSLNQITFGEDLGKDKTLGYPYADKTNLASGPFNADAISIFIPGLYDARIYYKVDFIEKPSTDHTPGMGVKGRRSSADDVLHAQGYQLYTDECKPSFSGLTDSNIAVLQLKVVKNNAVTPDSEDGGNSLHTISLQLDSSVDTPTAVQYINADFSPYSNPQYFNLNGVRIHNRNLSPGLYILTDGSSAPKKVFIQ